MRWFVGIVVVLVLAGAGLWYYAGILKAVEDQTEVCVQGNSQFQLFLRALRDKDVSLCDTIAQPMKSQCQAYVLEDPALCLEYDSGCRIIASKNESACPDVICRAMISGDPAACNELEGDERQSCIDQVTFNIDAFALSEKECKETAKGLVSLRE